MAPGMRSSLSALALCLMAGGALAAGPASTWSDPPARKAEGDRPASPAPKPAPPPAVASQTKDADPPAGMAMSRRERVAARPKQRKAHVAARPAPRRQPVAVSRHPAPVLVQRRPPPFVAGAYPAYRAVDFPHDYEDARLERLGTAVRSGYLVMGRRSVVYPDGRVIHVYRPIEAGEDD